MASLALAMTNKKAPAETGALRSFSAAKLLQRPEPVIDIPVNLILGKAVALLQLAFELLAAAFDHIEIVIGELAPLLLGLALELLPITFNLVPIHRHLLQRWDDELNDCDIQSFRERIQSFGNTRLLADQLAALASRRRAVRMYSV